MPKEYCHWVMAEKIREVLPPSSLRNIILENRNLYRIGAVIPDSPLYRIRGKKKKEFHRVAQNLHGHHGENTLSFIPYTARVYDGRMNPQIWAFLLGMVTHIAADSQFHPLVFYFCGNQHSHNPQISEGAVYRHRRFETDLDFFYKQNFPLPHADKVDVLIKNIEMNQRKFLNLVHSIYFHNSPVDVNEISRTLNWHRFLQKIFYSKIFFNFFKILNQFPFLHLDDFLALFYFPQKEIPVHFYQKLIKYRHPVTGEQKAESIQTIEARVVEKAREIFSIIDHSLTTKHPEIDLGRLKGPSLSTGLENSSSEEMKHFQIQPPEILFNIGKF